MLSQKTSETSEEESFSSYLSKEYEKKQKVNPSYSLRAFANFLGVDQSTLSKFLKGKRSLSWQAMLKCMEKLDTPKELVKCFEYQKDIINGEYNSLKSDQLEATGDWLCWAILEKFKTDTSIDINVLAQRFSVEPERADNCLRLLVRMGFLEENGDGYKLLQPNNCWVDCEKTSAARKELQRKLLGLSLDALERVDISERYHGSLTVAVDKSKLPEIQNKLAAFQKDLGQYIQRSGDLSEVYQLTLSFFPLERNEAQ